MGELEDQEGRPDPVEGGGDSRARLPDRPATDPPDEQRRDGGEHDRDGAEREPATAEEQEPRHRQQRLLRSAVGLAPEEGGDLAAEHVAGHQPDDRLVRVGHPERRAIDPDPQEDPSAADGREQRNPAERHPPAERCPSERAPPLRAEFTRPDGLQKRPQTAAFASPRRSPPGAATPSSARARVSAPGWTSAQILVRLRGDQCLWRCVTASAVLRVTMGVERVAGLVS